MSGTAEPLRAFCLHQMNDFVTWNQMLVAHLSHAVSPFGLKYMPIKKLMIDAVAVL
jgi:hypothetical protein